MPHNGCAPKRICKRLAKQSTLRVRPVNHPGLKSGAACSHRCSAVLGVKLFQSWLCLLGGQQLL